MSQTMPRAPVKEMFSIPAQTQVPFNPYQQVNMTVGKMMSPKVPKFIDFNYDHDFDEGGVFYYLGTQGRKRPWQNPHDLGLVLCFTSSIGNGRVEEIVGRSVVNCRTLNESFSFFGVDLGQNRLLAPTCYSIRNRNSSTHVLLNWHFEGSNDKVNWVLLDRRIFLSENPLFNKEIEAEQRLLCEKGASSTWAIETSIYSGTLNAQAGFRYFRVVQVGKNSSASDNLTLSGLEIYGRVSQNTQAWDF